MIVLINGDDVKTLYVQQDIADKGAAHWIAKRGGNWREATDSDLTAHGFDIGEGGRTSSPARLAFKLAEDTRRLALVKTGYDNGVASAKNPANVDAKLRASIRGKLIAGQPLTEEEADLVVRAI